MKKIHFSTKIIFVTCMSIIMIASVIGYFSFSNYQKSMLDKISNSIMQAFVQTNELMDSNIRSYENTLILVSGNKTIQQVLATTFSDQYDWYIGYNDLMAETTEISVSHFDNPSIRYYLLREQNIKMSQSFTSPNKLFPEDYVEKNLATYGITCLWSDIRVNTSLDSTDYYILVSKLCVNETRKTNDAIAYIIVRNETLFKDVNRLNYENGDIFVLSEDQEILYAQNKENTGKTYSQEQILKLTAEQTKGLSVRTINGKKSLVVFNRENKNNWTLVGILPYETVTSEITATKSSVFWLTLIVTIVAVGSVFLYLHNNTKKISQLSAAMERVGNGEMDIQLRLNGRGEIDRMGNVFVFMLSKIKQQINELEEAQKREYKLQLQALQEQMNPHLLYNTLATINSYAEEIDAHGISEIVLSLISYYRLTLSGGMEYITVKDEISHALVYVEIMKARLGEKLIVNTEIDERVYPFSCLKLILQPFIENSIYHGFSNRDRFEGTIVLRASLQEDTVVFRIEDNGMGMSEELIEEIMTEQGSGYAVRNTDARIKLHYGDAYGVRIISGPGQGCKVIITIPAEMKEPPQ